MKVCKPERKFETVFTCAVALDGEDGETPGNVIEFAEKFGAAARDFFLIVWPGCVSQTVVLRDELKRRVGDALLAA